MNPVLTAPPIVEDEDDPNALCLCGCPVGAHVNEQGHCRICDCEEVALPVKANER